MFWEKISGKTAQIRLSIPIGSHHHSINPDLSGFVTINQNLIKVNLLKHITFLFSLVLWCPLFSQSILQQTLSINTAGTAADPSALLDVAATDKGILVPRMTSAQRGGITAPATGLLVFDLDSGSFQFFNGTVWVNLSTPKILADADGNTKIQVEENPNEDVIRFDLGGDEKMVLQKNAAGHARLELPTALTFNTFVGEGAGSANNTGLRNTALGFQALLANTAGYDNVATGKGALAHNTTGFYNTALGSSALGDNTIGQSNTAAGFQTLLQNTTGNYNSAFGGEAMVANSSGEANTALGWGTLQQNTLGERNSASGFDALLNNATGSYNTANGESAMFNNMRGNGNSALGSQTLYLNTSSADNTAVGSSALHANVSGSNNTALGKSAGVTAGNLSNATALGSQALVNADNKVRIGNSSVMVIEGQVDWTFPSDARFKFDVDDHSVPGLSLLEKLRPVTYRFDSHKFDLHLMSGFSDSLRQKRLAASGFDKTSARLQTGFLAQEVELACREFGYEFSGLHIPSNESDNYGLAYASFVPVLVKGVQELSGEVKRQQSRLDLMEAENATLKNALHLLAGQVQQLKASLDSTENQSRNQRKTGKTGIQNISL
jgi:hypothetical protein